MQKQAQYNKMREGQYNGRYKHIKEPMYQLIFRDRRKTGKSEINCKNKMRRFGRGWKKEEKGTLKHLEDIVPGR